MGCTLEARNASGNLINSLLPHFQLDIFGHSGDEIEIPFVSSSRPLTNNKERLDTLKVGSVILKD